MSQEALDYCQAEVRDQDHDRYLLALIAGAKVRADYWAVLAFHLEISRAETAVSEVMLGEMRLQWWRDVVESLYQDHPRRHHVVQALDQARQRGHLAKADLLALIDGYGPVVNFREIETVAEFETQARGYTGGLIRLLVACHGVTVTAKMQPVIDAAAITWAVAAAIRAQGRLGEKRRLLLPLELLQRHAVNVEDIYRYRMNDAVRAAFIDFADLGHQHYNNARQCLSQMPWRGRTPLLLGTLGKAYLKAFAKARHDPFGRPLQLNAGYKPLLLSLKALARQI